MPSDFFSDKLLEEKHFDYLLVVLFDADFAVQRAALIPHRLVRELAVYRRHVNAHIVMLRDALWKRPEVEDVTIDSCVNKGTSVRFHV